MTSGVPKDFPAAYDRLLRIHLEQQLPGASTADSSTLSEADVRVLLGGASVLALSPESRDRLTAYEVTTRLLEMSETLAERVVAAADVVLSRIGNFPGRTLLRRRFASQDTEGPTVSPRLALERIAREVENTVDLGDGREVTLTDFQFGLFEQLDQNRTISVSAPTSAGKSFVMGLDLVRRMRQSGSPCVVYVVPTRALIREVSLLVRRQLAESKIDGIPIRTVPFPLAPDQAPRGAVFVLTQERLMSLLHSTRGAQWITTLIVDEAQNINDDARGVLLQSAVEAVMIRFPRADIHFASPLTSNPQFLIDLFDRRAVAGQPIIETLPAVSQSVVLVEPVRGKPQLADFSLVDGDNPRVALGRRKLPFRLRDGVFDQRAALAYAITKDDEATILYANRADYTEELASALTRSEHAVESDPLDGEVQELIDFCRSEIHAEYPLIECLPFGVAFHYGSMPALVRSRVEDLFKGGKLKFVCCTSTLLQGVNLPARHIILENPKCGSDPMTRGEFLNLAGRAGRLLQEFHGTVWCIRPTQWEKQSFTGPNLQPLEAAFHGALADGGTLVRRLLENAPVGDDDIDLGEAVFGKLFCDVIRAGKDIATLPAATPENVDALRETGRILDTLKITLPTELLDANRTVRPDRLQSLYEFLASQLDLGPFLPLKPGQNGAMDRMGDTIKLIQERLRGITNDSHTFFRWLATQWIFNKPLNEIISNRIGFVRSRKTRDEPDGDKRPVSTIIRELLQALETEIRFRLVKHYMAYLSVLALVLKERGLDKVAEELEPFHVYLECGATNPVALSLIALGLSRVTALALRDRLRFPDDATPEDCLAIIAVSNLSAARVPRVCIREVAELFPLTKPAGVL
jgi:superfamily II DNA/RNA helicase